VEAGAAVSRGRALILVRNTSTHDSRVFREARTLEELGYEPLVLAVTSDQERRARSVESGIPVVRISPTSPLAWARARLASRRRGAARPPAAADPEPGGSSSGGPLRALLVRLHRWARTLDYYRRAIRFLREQRPALVHCNDYNTMWIGVAARALGTPAVVYDAHELWPDRNLRPEPRTWLLLCEAVFVRVADSILTASPGYAEVMARRYRVQPPQVIRNIPDRDGSAPAELASTRSAASAQVAAYAGALTRNRGLEVAIRALARVPDARLRLVGPVLPAYRVKLERLAEREGVTERLELEPPVRSEALIGALAGCDAGLALIQPACLSYEVSLPNKLFEYVHAGLPVLASDLPVIGRFVEEHGIGLVARPDDVADVASKLSELLQPERNEAFRAAAREAAAELSWESESRLLASAYEEAATARSRRS
jgi:glycosyltransferase involved in cell wall biosynthesis